MAQTEWVLILDEQFASEILSTKIRDIPTKDKHRLLLSPILSLASTIHQPNSSLLFVDMVRDKTFIVQELSKLYDLDQWIDLTTGLKLWQEKSFVMNVVKVEGYSFLKYACESLRNDKEIVLLAVKHNEFLFKSLSDKMKSDRDIAMCAIERDPWLLRYATEESKNDKQIVMKAVSQSGYALEFASESLRNDRDFISHVFKHDTAAIEYSDYYRVLCWK